MAYQMTKNEAQQILEENQHIIYRRVKVLKKNDNAIEGNGIEEIQIAGLELRMLAIDEWDVYVEFTVGNIKNGNFSIYLPIHFQKYRD
jgi:hypothetical protein